MDKIRFKARQIPTGIPGAVMFQADELVDDLAQFLREQHRFEKRKKQKDPDYELFFDLELKRWYKRRSLSANNLQWEICTRLAAADNVKKEIVHNSVREIFYPREEYHGVFVPKDGSELTSMEFAKVIEALVIWCIDRPDPVDIYDIWILFTQWRFGQEKDPLEGSYSGKEDYKEKHPCCEACGKFLLITDNYGVRKHNGQLAHIVSVGAGSIDKDFNWLLLCPDCHLKMQHQKGWEAMLKYFAHLQPKVERARTICGKKALAGADDSQGPEKPLPADPSPPPPAPQQTGEDDQAELVKRVFRGEITEPQLKGPEQDPDEAEKQKMVKRIKSMAGQADEHRKKYYKRAHPNQPGLFDEKTEKVDPKTAQYKDAEDDVAVEPQKIYNEDGTFAVPPDF